MIRACVAALLLLPPAAVAQGNAGPFGGLFGRTPERIGAQFTVLEARGGVAGQYESAMFFGNERPDPDIPASGTTAGVMGGLAFERRTDRLRLQASGGATYQEFHQQPVYGATTYDAGVRAVGDVTTRLELAAEARYLRSPLFRFLPGFSASSPVLSAPGDPAFIRLLRNDSYEVTGGVLHRYAKHSSVRASVSQRHMGLEARDSFDAFRAEGRWQRQLTRDAAVYAGYAREEYTQTVVADARYVHEYLDLGVDFARQLSLSRRTSLAFTTQTSVMNRPDVGRAFRLNGSASVARIVGRTGNVSVGVSRNTEFMLGFVEPLFSTGVNASASGMPSLRTEWLASASAGRGRLGFSGTDDLTTAQFSSRFSYALTSKLGLYAQYAAYYYEMPPNEASFAVFGQASRQAFTIGINTWIPVINKMRVPRDPE